MGTVTAGVSFTVGRVAGFKVTVELSVGGISVSGVVIGVGSRVG